MTVYCPKCGNQAIDPITDPQKIDEEVDQILFQQLEHCYVCGHEWLDKWWKVWTPDGVYTVDADEFGNAKK